jgi:hypothetical protein
MVVSARVACAQCGGRILPGEPWNLGHDDANPSRYMGAEHRRCNRATSRNGRPEPQSLLEDG